MNRRTALSLAFLGGLIPNTLFAQTRGRKGLTRARFAEANDPEVRRDATPVDDPEPADAADAPGMPREVGQKWRRFDISRYTKLASNQTNPQNAIVDWIFRRTGTAAWHGEKVSSISAGRAQLRVYHDEETLRQVGAVVERFTNSQADILSVRVRFVAAVDTRWRYAVFSRLTHVGGGPQGQQIWTLKLEDAAFVLAQMEIYQGFRILADRRVEMVNGQTLTIERSEPRGYTGSIQRDSAAGLGFQPKNEQLKEGVFLKVSPLMTFEGDALDAAIDLNVNTVRNYLRTKVIAPREIGSNEMSIDVPEVVETRLSNYTVKDWPLGQTLLISAGIHPGILQAKGGFMNLRIPGTVPSSTEVLVFIDIEAVDRPRAARRDRDREVE